MSHGHSMFRSLSHASLTWTWFSGLSRSIEAFSWAGLPAAALSLYRAGTLLGLFASTKGTIRRLHVWVLKFKYLEVPGTERE